MAKIRCTRNVASGTAPSIRARIASTPSSASSSAGSVDREQDDDVELRSRAVASSDARSIASWPEASASRAMWSSPSGPTSRLNSPT